MQENKNLVEEALIQMKNVEDVIAENAKGILASTMKEEISQLVKESLFEQDEDELDMDSMDSMDSEEEVDVDVDMSSDDDEGVEVDFETDNLSDMEEPIDLTGASDEEILKVFKAMGEEDGIIVKKDDEMVHLMDNEKDSEYLIKLGESEEENYENMEYNEEVDDDKVQDVIDAIFDGDSNMKSFDSSDEFEEKDEEVMYEIEFDEESDDEDEMMESDDEDEMMESDDDEMMESDDDEMMESDDEDEMMESDDDEMMESYNHKKAKRKEGKMSMKPKGVGIGKGPKFSFKSSEKGGFDEKKKEAPKSIGTGKAKFDYKKGENMEAKSKVVKKVETKEAARTYGMGSKEGRGLRKGITNNRNYVYGKSGVKVESTQEEVNMLREKNEEYRKALNVFREKLNEVAIFNSNLAYATRIFTEHSTTKKEKINILRRFDNVQTLKESKSLYRGIKDELTQTETKSMNETVENKLVQNVQTGSSTSLIESKTYEAPQFLRIKDLMSKLK